MSYYTSNTAPLGYGNYNPGIGQRSGINHLQQPQIPGIQSSNAPQSEQAAAAAAAAQQHGRQGQARQVQPDELKTSSADTPKKERKNRPGMKFGAKKKSWVWSWFVQDNSDPNIAACDYCGKIIIRLASDKGSPKKLSEHLRTHKLNKDTINYSRSVPIDGYGVTFTNSGEPINYPSNYEQAPQSTQTSAAGSVAGNAVALDDDKRRSAPPKTKQADFNTVASAPKRFLSAEFDNSPYTSMKFHRHLMKFLTENKLPINAIKSKSFRQLIYDLRSDSVNDLLELTNLYSSLIEVSRYSDGPGNPDPEASAVNALANVVENKMNNS
ncbi:hypotehtical protein [Scheffersomyces stipitis CBS 6054]|uniref:Hypotehtical protein n=1 Tax=Scheffersomyces stipitis (strain ATCC 58785 / CBS 6054 / NBRC 10063 / NRRL Y-11545) TaxID=322104 RepID=A3LQA6_PICST|nr:hypotehtical protein [Scheffersomyces stipitis CBS 6054]ABN64646.2 hypotehtical protein [Scheffersomyces stipitis CBS 6054]KAG2736931.1 hypothetical protein G9P44_001021 [Scheffersomyces stipitis]